MPQTSTVFPFESAMRFLLRHDANLRVDVVLWYDSTVPSSSMFEPNAKVMAFPTGNNKTKKTANAMNIPIVVGL